MSGHAGQAPPWIASDVVHERCRELGVLVFSCDERGAVIATPRVPGPVGRWCRAAGLAAQIAKAAAAALSERDGTARPLFPGATVQVRHFVGPGRRAGVTALLALDEAAPGATEFESFCREVQLDPSAVTAALGPWTGAAPEQRAEAFRLLGWMQEDLARRDEDALALIDLSEQLSDAYEQISAIYHIGRSMNWLSSPRQFASSVCRQIHHLLSYDWIAMQYVPSALSLPGLGAQLIVAGELPCEARVFSQVARRLVESWRDDQWTTLLEVGQSELATLVSSQVVAECITHDGVVVGAILAGNKRGIDNEATSIETQLLDVASEFVGVFHQNAVRYDVQRSMFLGTVRALSSAIDAKDRYTRGHSERVGLLGSQLARATGMSDERAERVYIAGIVHDVGKIGVPEAVLGKPGRLTEAEFDLVKKHPVIGYEILRDIPPMRDVLPGVLHHHERWDGDGYPDGLAGDAIPMLGRLLAVVDAFDAMSSDRAYRPRRTREQVLEVLRDGAGSQWDPEYVEAFLTLDLDAYDSLSQRHATLAAQQAA